MISVDKGQQSAYFPLRINKSQGQGTNSVVPINFPSTRNVLWESKPVGEFETLALTLPKQAVQLFIVEKTLRLAHRYAEDKRVTSFLLGSLYPRSDEGGICFGVDRFDPGREITEKIGESVTKSKVPTAVVPGDHIIPITLKKELLTPDDSISHTKDEFVRAIQVIESKICGKDTLTLSHVLSLKANLYCCREQDELIITLHCGAIVPHSKFQARPIAPLAIIPTTLARNLAGPLRLSDVQGTPKMGYVTMDQTRKLLLLLESDPKVYNLPLIGIWISGVHNVYHPYVWASCLRYLNCSEIKDRVLHSSGSFLLLHYSIAQKIPDFWECFPDNDEKLDFELLNCQENLHIDLDDCSSKEPSCFNLDASPTGMNKALFDEAIVEWKNSRNMSGYITLGDDENDDNNDKGGYSSSSSGFKNEDNPRPSPSRRPSPTQAKTPNAPAPEESLSLSFDEALNNFRENQPDRTPKENTKILAPRFNQTHNTNLSNTIPKKSDFAKLSRQPLKQITPHDPGNSPSTFLGRGKPIVPSQASRKGENKENTPLTSRNVPQGNIHRTGKNSEPFCERNSNAPPGQSFRVHHEKALSDKKSSNPRIPMQLTHSSTAVRKRYHSAEVQSYEMQLPAASPQARSNSLSSLAVSDEDDFDDISSESSFTKNNEARRLTNQSPSTINPFYQPSSNHHINRSPNVLQGNPHPKTIKSKQSTARLPSNSNHETDQSSKCISSNLSHEPSHPQIDVYTENQGSPDNSPHNSPKVSNQAPQSFRGGSHVSSHPDANQRSPPAGPDNIGRRFEERYEPSYSTTRQNTVTKRQSFGGKPQPRDAPRRRVSDTDMRQSSSSESSSRTYHGKPQSHQQFGNNHLNQQCSDVHSDANQQTTFKNSVNMENQFPNSSFDGTQAFQTRSDVSTKEPSFNAVRTVQQSPHGTSRNSDSQPSTKYNNQQSSLKRPGSPTPVPVYHQEADHTQQESANVYDDAINQNSPSHVSNALQQGDAAAINREYKKEQNVSSNKDLEEQVKRQEDMIRVLQEQVRSLLRIKEAISPEGGNNPSFPLTPASTPVSTLEDSERLSNQAKFESEAQTATAYQTVDGKREAENVTIGVNTGPSLLWENSRDNSCEKCCECKRLQSDELQQGRLDHAELPEEGEVFLTPETTGSLRDPSQVNVQTHDSTRSSSPICDMIVPSAVDLTSRSNRMPAGNRASQDAEPLGENEVTVKGREFYDKLLCQVKDFLSEQVSTGHVDSTRETEEQPAARASPSPQVPTREVVVKATLKQLEKIKRNGQDSAQQSPTRMQGETSNVFSTYQRSVSTSFIPEHPKLNYVSLSVDDTFDEVTYIDEVALKYLSDEELKRFKSEVRPSSGAAAVKRSFTRTVRFGSLPSDHERRCLQSRSLREIDFTWNNLSFCTKNYLKKYNLVEGQVSVLGQDDDQDSPCTTQDGIDPCKPPAPSPVHDESEGSSHILDIRRLKNLPKLF